MDINKVTEKAREAVTQAQSIAVGMGHQDIDSEHLALALSVRNRASCPASWIRWACRPPLWP